MFGEGPPAEDGRMNAPILPFPIQKPPHRETELEFLKREALAKQFEQRLARREARRARIAALLHREAA